VGGQRSGSGDLEAEMTSATKNRAKGASRGEGYGMVVFAAVLWGLCAYGSRQNLGN
jgi:hypothetical protein